MKYKMKKFIENRSIEDAENTFEQRLLDAKYIFDKHSKNFYTRNCPICGSDEYEPAEKFHDTYGVDKCKSCASLFVNPVPSVEALSDYYNNCKCNELLRAIYKKRHLSKSNFIQDERVVAVEDLIKKLQQKKSTPIKILEIGCNEGTFLARLKASLEQNNISNVEFFGIDIDNGAIENSVDETLNLKCTSVEDFTKTCDSSFDIILHFELIEHLEDPRKFMFDLNKILTKGGFMMFTTPSADGLENVGIGYNSKRYIAHAIFPPMHLNAFSYANMTHFAISTGFKICNISTPGSLDMGILSVKKDFIEDEGLKELVNLDDDTKGLVQHCISLLNVSSHMRCIFTK